MISMQQFLFSTFFFTKPSKQAIVLNYNKICQSNWERELGQLLNGGKSQSYTSPIKEEGQFLSYRLILPAKYQECIARLPNARILARDDKPWIIPNFLFIAASFGFTFATSTFFDHPTSSPMLLSLSTLCLCFISWRTIIEITEDGGELSYCIEIRMRSSKQVKLGQMNGEVSLSSWSTAVGRWQVFNVYDNSFLRNTVVGILVIALNFHISNQLLLQYKFFFFPPFLDKKQ